MQRCEKNEATLGYRMPKMHQAPVAVHRAMRLRKTKQARGKPLKLCTVPIIAISATNVAKALPRIVETTPFASSS